MSRGKRTQKWKSGDLFSIPLKDGSKLLGQIIAPEPSAMNSVSCALFDQRFQEGFLGVVDLDKLIATCLVTPGSLDSGMGEVIGNAKVEIARRDFPFESLRSQYFIGAKIYGAKIVGEFANAFCALCPWDDWADPKELDKLLISPAKKPCNLVYKGEL